MQCKTITCGALSFILAVLTGHAQVRPELKSSATASSNSRNIRSQYGNVPLMFEANQGQTDPRSNSYLAAADTPFSLPQADWFSHYGLLIHPHPGFVPQRQSPAGVLRVFLQFVSWKQLESKHNRRFLPSILLGQRPIP